MFYFGYTPIHNASQIYAEGITSSLLAAERTYLAWIRTIISIVGFGLVLAHYFSPTDAIGSFVAAFTTAMCGALLYLATQRYYHIIFMLDHKRFDADGLTPILVTALMGGLIALILLGGLHQKLVSCGCWKSAQGDQSDRNQDARNHNRNLSSHSRNLSSHRQSLLTTKQREEEHDRDTMNLTSVLSADAVS